MSTQVVEIRAFARQHQYRRQAAPHVATLCPPDFTIVTRSPRPSPPYLHTAREQRLQPWRPGDKTMRESHTVGTASSRSLAGGPENEAW